MSSKKMNSLMKRSLTLVALIAAVSSVHAQQPDAAHPYGKVVDGTKVTPGVMEGFRAWRASACDRCHGANQEGLVGPSLIESMKTISKDDFKKTITEGRVEKGMPSWKESKTVMDHMDDLYAYLKGRSDGAITKAHVELQK
jgi:mono/diheme cytochrome c family protein